jgi:hypothetical protein
VRVRVEEDDSSERDRGAGCWSSWRDLRRFEERERLFLAESEEEEEEVVATGVGSMARKGARLSMDKRRLHTFGRGQCPGLAH